MLNKSRTQLCYIGFGTLSVSHMSTTYQYNSACGKREAHHNWSMVVHEEAAPAPGTTLMTSGPMRADSSAVNAIGTQMCDLINSSTLIGTDPMAVDILWTPSREARGIPRVINQIQHECEE